MNDLDKLLQEIDRKGPAPAYLLSGEEFLARKAADELVKKLLPDAAVGLNLAVLDGGSPREVAQELATLPLFPGRKVVLARDPEFVAPRKGRTNPLGKALDAWRAGRRKEAARRVLAIAERAGWGASQLDPTQPGAPSAEAWREELNIELGEADLAFLREVAELCREEGISAPESDLAPLVALLDKGLPEGQVLVIAATEVDAKNPLVRWIEERGKVVARKPDYIRGKLDLGAVTANMLAPLGKRLHPSAVEELQRRIGDNMRLLQSELEKLAAYVEGDEIRRSDVQLLVANAREEPFLELTKALQGRDVKAALQYAESAFRSDVHGLQLLGAVASIVRGLLENRERLTHLWGGRLGTLGAFESDLYPDLEKEAKARKQKLPKAYAVYKSMEAAAGYSRSELLEALVACAEADLALKTSADQKVTIERLLWRVCAGRRAA